MPGGENFSNPGGHFRKIESKEKEMDTQSVSPRKFRLTTTWYVSRIALSFALGFALTVFANRVANAQTYSVLHNFTLGGDGGTPYFGVVLDHAENLYGSTIAGGIANSCGGLGCGVVYKVPHQHLTILSPLYKFAGGSDGANPTWLTFGGNGTIYGVTLAGGGAGCGGGGCGTVFNLRPPSHSCASISCPWSETQLYSFQGQPDAATPLSLVFSNGNIFGVSEYGGVHNGGAIFELMPSGSGWTEQVIYSFTGGQDGYYPNGALVIDSLGKLYGTAFFGGQYGYGTIFELSPSGSGWTEMTLWAFGMPGTTGKNPAGGLISDSTGNLYGSTEYDTLGGQGAVFELSPSNGGWTYQELYDLRPGSGGDGSGPYAPLTMDGAGDLYGTTYGNSGSGDFGTVYELTPSGGSWHYTLLYQFRNGFFPESGVTLDAQGNLYGTTTIGGDGGYGVVWEIVPVSGR